MGSSSILINSDTKLTSASSTYTNTLTGGTFFASANTVKYYTAGVISNLGVRVSANATTGGTSTGKLTIGGVDQTQTFTVTTGTPGYYEDATHTDAIANGNIPVFTLVTGTGGGITFKSIMSIFTATTNTVTKLNCEAGATMNAANTYFIPIAGRLTTFPFPTVETFMKTRMKHAGTIKNLQTSTSNGASSAVTYTVRLNGADTSPAITTIYTTGQTGTKEDVTHTSSIAVNDDIDYSLVTSGTVSNLPFWTCVEFESTASYATTVCAIGSGYGQADTTTEFHPIGGNMLTNTTESVAQVKAGAAFTFSNLRCMQSVSDTPTATLTLMKGGAAQTQTFATTASSTGLFEDTTHSDIVAAGDLVDIRVVASSVSGAHLATLTWIAMDSLLVSTVTIPHTVFIEWEET